MLKITEHNAETGEVIERDLTAAELNELKAIQAEDVKKMQKRQQEAAATEAVIEKLGLTPEEVAALLA